MSAHDMPLAGAPGWACFATVLSGSIHLHWHSNPQEADAAWSAAARRGSEGAEVYQALARFSAKSRNADAVVAVRSWWLDLDIRKHMPTGHTPEDYTAALNTAFNRAADMCRTRNMPQPSVAVESGGGVWFHWTCERDVTPAEWMAVARGLRAAATATFGVWHDGQCTTDITRLVRSPGTRNHKRGEEAVYVPLAPTGSTGACSYEAMRDALGALGVLAETPAARRADDLNPFKSMALIGTPSAAAGAFAAASKGAEASAAQIVTIDDEGTGCVLIKRVVESEGDCGGDLWKGVVTVLRECHDGAEYIEQLGRQFPDYGERWDVDSMVAHCASFNKPRTCAMLRDTYRSRFGRDACEGCRHLKASQERPAQSPIGLGFERSKQWRNIPIIKIEAPAQDEFVETEDGIITAQDYDTSAVHAPAVKQPVAQVAHPYSLTHQGETGLFFSYAPDKKGDGPDSRERMVVRLSPSQVWAFANTVRRGQGDDGNDLHQIHWGISNGKSRTITTSTDVMAASTTLRKLGVTISGGGVLDYRVAVEKFNTYVSNAIDAVSDHRQNADQGKEIILEKHLGTTTDDAGNTVFILGPYRHYTITTHNGHTGAKVEPAELTPTLMRHCESEGFCAPPPTLSESAALKTVYRSWLHRLYPDSNETVRYQRLMVTMAAVLPLGVLMGVEDYRGCILFRSSGSGASKSTSVGVGLAMWTQTPRAIIERNMTQVFAETGRLMQGAIPLVMDEVGKNKGSRAEKADLMREIIMGGTAAGGRRTATQLSDAIMGRVDVAPMIATSNINVLEHAQNADPEQAEALAARLIDVDVPAGIAKWDDMNAFNDFATGFLKEGSGGRGHGGRVGHVLVSEALRYLPQLQALRDKWMTRWQDYLGLRENQSVRFHATVGACFSAAAEFAFIRGFTPYEPEAMIRTLMDSMQLNRKVEEFRKQNSTPLVAVARALVELAPHCAMVRRGASIAATAAHPPRDGWMGVVVLPSSGDEVTSECIRISSKHLLDKLRELGMNSADARDAMEAGRIRLGGDSTTADGSCTLLMGLDASVAPGLMGLRGKSYNLTAAKAIHDMSYGNN